MGSLETFTPAFPDIPKPMISHGLPYTEACQIRAEDLGVSRVYIIASGTLSRTTNRLKQLQQALGDKVVGIRMGMTSHTLLNEVLEVLQEVNDTKADCLITLGGGSLSDAAKIISHVRSTAVAHFLARTDNLQALCERCPRSRRYNGSPESYAFQLEGG